MKTIKVTPETAYKLLLVPIPVLAKRKGVGHKTIALLCEEYRKIILAKAEAMNE